MAAAKRELTIEDVSEITACSAEREAQDVYRLIERVAAETMGWRLFTAMRYVEAAGAVERIHSSDEGSGGWPQADRQDHRQPRRHGAGRGVPGRDQGGGAQGLLRPRAR